MRTPAVAVSAGQWLTWVSLSAAVIALLLRTLAVAEPLGIDQSLWASAVRGLARGQRLYVDVWEQRPPGIYLTYWAGFALFRWSASAVAWLDVMAATATTVLLYVIGGRLAGRNVGALAAAFYAAFTMPASLYSYGGFLERAVCETFIVVCVGGAVCCAIAMRRAPGSSSAWGLGLMLGLAVLFKPNAALYAPGLFIWGMAGGVGLRSWRRWARRLVLAGIGAALPALLVILWLWQARALGDARTAVIDFNRWYVSAGFEPGPYALALSKAIWLRIKTDPLWAGGAIASVVALWRLGRDRKLPDVAAVAVLWGVGAFVVIVVNGNRLFNSYFSQAHAPLALLLAGWLGSGWSARGRGRILVAATVVLVAGLSWQRGMVTRVAEWAKADALVLTGRLDRAAYLDRFGGYDNGRGYSARANDELGRYVEAHTTTRDRIYLFGINGAGVYFLADRLTAQRFLRVNFFVPDDFPDPRFTLSAVVDDLRQDLPAYLIFETLHSVSAMGQAVDALPHDPRLRELLTLYIPEARIEDFTLYRRR